MTRWQSDLLEELLAVQAIDLKIRGLDQEKGEHFERSKQEDPVLSGLKSDVARLEKAIETTTAQHEMYQDTLEDIRTAIKGLATTKSGAPKPRTRSSTEALRIEEEKLSTLLQETNQQIKQLEDERKKLNNEIAVRASEVEENHQGPEEAIRKINARVRRLAKQRNEAVKGMPTMLLRRYDRLRSSRSGIGLTVLRDGVCTICRMQMPTAILAQIGRAHV
jgi:uncharacterized protein